MKGCLVSDSRGDANILFRHQHQVLKTNMKGIFSPKVVGFSGMAWVFQRHHCWKRLSLQKTGQSLPPKVFFMELYLIRIELTSQGAWVSSSC